MKSTGLLKLLGAKSDGGGSIADVLGKGDVDRDQEKAFQGVGGVGVASGNDRCAASSRAARARARGRRGQPARRRAASRAAAPATARASSTVKGVVKTEAPAVDGELDPEHGRQGGARAPRRHQGLLRARPEAQPEPDRARSSSTGRSPQAGTVSGVDVEQDTLGDAEVASCIKSLIARWRFPAPSGGSVDVSFPFVFQASQ